VFRGSWRPHAHVVEQLDVPVAIGERVAEADGGVADDARMLLHDGPVGGRVLLGCFLRTDHELRRVRVDDRRARVDARERVVGVGLDRRGHVRVATRAGHAVECDLDQYRLLTLVGSFSRMQTRITEMLGIEHPIVQAPMGFIARAPLASAVSNAGGLGIIETSSGQLSEVRGEITKMRELTGKPFGVNIAQLFVRDNSIVDFVAENGVTFVTTSAGDPTKFTAALKDAGITVFHVVPSLRGALKAVDAGVDGLVVEGNEGGGFKAPTGASTMVLLPLIASRVDVPIIAAGGVCDGRSMAAALTLGAEGVQMGTRMVSAAESPVHENWKNLICSSTEGDTLLLNRNAPPAFRVLRTEFSEAAEGEGRAVIPQLDRVHDLYFGGNMEASFAFSGQVAGRITEVLPVRQVLEQTIADCETVLRETAARFTRA
jgi:enoyl-[acyl-carrier protein] reductase II